jgi:GNAT superfamily N-acetyltransferase
MAITTRELNAKSWDDLVTLFGPERGAQGGCWCMWWRMTSAEFEKASREERRDDFRRLVDDGVPLGVLAYDRKVPVGWCAVGPRESLPKLMRSRVAGPLEGETGGVWMINCFYVDRNHRGEGLMRTLIDAAAEMAGKHGARVVEACPIDTERKLMWGEGHIGLAQVFAAAGFSEVARRSPTRPLMRKSLQGVQ